MKWKYLIIQLSFTFWWTAVTYQRTPLSIIKYLRFSIFIKKLLKYLPIVILQKVIDINKLKIINHPIIPLPFEDHPWLTKGQHY